MLRSRGLLVDYVGELEVVLLENIDDLVGMSWDIPNMARHPQSL